MICVKKEIIHVCPKNGREFLLCGLLTECGRFVILIIKWVMIAAGGIVWEGAEIVHPVVNIYRNGMLYRASEEELFYELEYRDRFEL